MNAIQLMQQETLSFFSQMEGYMASALTALTPFQIIWSITIIGLSFIFRNILTSGVLNCTKLILRRMLPEHFHVLIEACRRPLSFLIPILGLFIAAYILPFPESIDVIFNQGLSIAFWILFFWAFANLSNGLFDVILSRKGTVDLMMLGILHLLKKIILIVLVCLAIVTILKTLHYPVASLLGALGIGGAALAFASKDTIANFFGSLSLVIDQPFKLGDNIKIGSDIDGTIQSIGLRSTHIRTLEGTLLSVPNNVLANYNINNWTDLTKRRVQQTLRLTYDTQVSVLKNIVHNIQQVIQTDKNMELLVINFFEFGESSLDIQLIYYIKETDYKQFLDIKEQMNFKIMEIVEKEGASFAFPSRSLYIGDEKIEKLLQRS